VWAAAAGVVGPVVRGGWVLNQDGQPRRVVCAAPRGWEMRGWSVGGGSRGVVVGRPSTGPGVDHLLGAFSRRRRPRWMRRKLASWVGAKPEVFCPLHLLAIPGPRKCPEAGTGPAGAAASPLGGSGPCLAFKPFWWGSVVGGGAVVVVGGGAKGPQLGGGGVVPGGRRFVGGGVVPGNFGPENTLPLRGISGITDGAPGPPPDFSGPPRLAWCLRMPSWLFRPVAVSAGGSGLGVLCCIHLVTRCCGCARPRAQRKTTFLRATA